MHNKHRNQIAIDSGKSLLIFYNKKPNNVITSKNCNDIIYHKHVYGYYTDYHIGMQNQYGHEIIKIIETTYLFPKRLPFHIRFLRKLIAFLQKLERRIS